MSIEFFRPRGQLMTGDCLDIVKTMPSGCVDLIITSPPYGAARQHTYGGISPSDYVDWFTPRAEQFKRVLKPTGSFVLNIKENAVGGERHTYVLDLILALKREVGFRWVEEYAWHKTTSMPGKWSNRFRDAWERLLHFTVAPHFKMNQDAVRVPIGEWAKRLHKPTELDKQMVASKTKSGFARRRAYWQHQESVYPTNVITAAPTWYNTGHSAPFPQAIPEFFIRLFADPGDVVLDPFVGSGTTAIVADRLKTKWIAIDISEAAIATATTNIRAALQQSSLPVR